MKPPSWGPRRRLTHHTNKEYKNRDSSGAQDRRVRSPTTLPRSSEPEQLCLEQLTLQFTPYCPMAHGSHTSPPKPSKHEHDPFTQWPRDDPPQSPSDTHPAVTPAGVVTPVDTDSGQFAPCQPGKQSQPPPTLATSQRPWPAMQTVRPCQQRYVIGQQKMLCATKPPSCG